MPGFLLQCDRSAANRWRALHLDPRILFCPRLVCGRSGLKFLPGLMLCGVTSKSDR